MTWKLLYAAEAARAIRKLDPQVRRRVRAAVESLAEDPWRGKPLQITPATTASSTASRPSGWWC